MIGILGGTFNPIHLGHLRLAEIALGLGISPIHFVPAHIPPHRREPEISFEHRINMVKLAIYHNPVFVLDLREQDRSGPSYMVDTLKSFRETYGSEQPLALLIGADSLNQLTSWHHWPDLFKLAHIIAFSRPTYSFTLSEALTPYLTPNITPCFTTPSGLLYCYFCETVSISSTKIRETLRHAQNPELFLHSSTYTYILNNKVCLLTNG